MPREVKDVPGGVSMWDFIRAERAPQHRCHWPGCNQQVTPRYWGCKMHWFRLPKPIRDEIWRTYTSGQEITKMPSAEYLAAAEHARIFAVLYNAGLA